MGRWWAKNEHQPHTHTHTPTRDYTHTQTPTQDYIHTRTHTHTCAERHTHAHPYAQRERQGKDRPQSAMPSKNFRGWAANKCVRLVTPSSLAPRMTRAFKCICAENNNCTPVPSKRAARVGGQRVLMGKGVGFAQTGSLPLSYVQWAPRFLSLPTLRAAADVIRSKNWGGGKSASRFACGAFFFATPRGN